MTATKTTEKKETTKKAPVRTVPVTIDWVTLPLTLVFETPLCGGVPRQGDLIESWLKRRMPKVPPEGAQSQAAVVAERVAGTDEEDLDEEMARVWVGFSKDDNGLYIRGANIRAHLKDSAEVIGQTLRDSREEAVKKNGHSFRQKFIDRVYIEEDRVYIEDGNGNIYQDPTGHRDATMTVPGPKGRGKQTCLKRVDYCEPAVLRCTIQLLDGSKVITRDAISAALQYGRVHGFGQDRSLQFGRYTFELGEQEEPEPGTWTTEPTK